VHLVVRDLEASRRFYGASSECSALRSLIETAAILADELFVSEGKPLTGRIHLAFQAPDWETVEHFHAAGLAAGGRDTGAPGERDYHPGHYAAGPWYARRMQSSSGRRRIGQDLQVRRGASPHIARAHRM
jgi:catechol 2,3-dioxygenase-like lactoylglutathione lyase family enzyme